MSRERQRLLNGLQQPRQSAPSPLRRFDPRVRLALALVASLGIMLPLEQLLGFIGAYMLILLWSRLLPAAARRIWRLKWMLLILFFVDWYLVDLLHAILIILRLALLTGSFAVVVETTPPGELRLIFHWLRVPHRYAFSLSIAFQSVDLLGEEWRLIQEAQQARGAWQPIQIRNWRELPVQVRQMVALTVPAVVLTTRRAWNLTEAAYARGFDAPDRRPYTTLQMGSADWFFLLVLLGGAAVLFLIF